MATTWIDRLERKYGDWALPNLPGFVVGLNAVVYVMCAAQPEFYRRLFASGEFSEAVRAGRQQLLAHKGRVCARGTYDLEDWLVPVLYEQDRLKLEFAEEAATESEDEEQPALPKVPLPYGFIGRD